MIELFKLAFRGISFSMKTSIGEANAMVTAEALNIDSLFPASETIKICGEQLYILFQNFLNGVLPSVKQIRIKVAETLYQYIN